MAKAQQIKSVMSARSVKPGRPAASAARSRPLPGPRSRPPSGLKWERKAGERPDALFEAALEVFSRQGYRASRLEDVASAAGVSKGTVYNYFENKEDLLKKALEHKIKTFLGQAETALDGFQGTHSDKLRFFMRRAWNRALTEDWGRAHKLILGEIAVELPDLFRIWIRKGILQSWKLAERIIQDGQAAGEFRAEADAAGAARYAMAGLTYQAFLQVHMGVAKLDPYPMAGIPESGMDLVIRGLQRAGKSGGKKK
ncbi:MAG: TetR/AcrR family transcriptional regulator [Fibrobacteres bacterium]|nr:TetR/AcrR family transcriptional regulator [Fibrobacterota bacterium]